MKVVLSPTDDHTGVADEEDIHNVPHLPPSYQPPFPQISSGESQVNELKTELKTSKRYSLSIDNRCKYSSKKSISSGSIKRKRILSCSEDSSNQANFIAITTPTFPSLSFLSPFNRHNYLLKSRDSRVIKSCQSPDPGSDYPSASPSLCDMSISSASYPATSPIITSFSSRVTAYLLRIIMIFVSITTKQDQSLHSKCVKHQTKALAFLLIISYSTMIVHGQPPPLPPAGFLDFDNLPVTRFSCEGKVIGGYYADVETGCQMFHVCTLGQKDEIQDIKFLCLNGTVFDQETRVCERVDEVDCAKAEEYFDLNLDLYVPHATTPKTEDLEEEDDNVRPVQSKAKSTSTTTPRTTTTTPTPSPRTRPPTTPSTPRSRGPPVISSSSQQSSSQQDDGEEDDDNNPYTSFNYYLKTPHSHVASGYNSQSRQSYLFNQPAASRSSGDTSSSVSSSSSSGRKVPAESGPKTVVYSSSSVSSSSTVRPKTVVIVKSTLPPAKSILKPKTLPTPIRTTTTTTTTPIPTKYELDDQYDDYYDDEDYTVEQQQNAPPSKGSVSYAQYPPPVSKTALISSERERYDFRDSRSSKGIGNAGLVTSTERGVKTSSQNIVTSSIPKHTTTTTSRNAPDIKVISSKFIETAASTSNSTEEPYYYEDDYPDDTSFQSNDQRQESKAQSISTSKSKSPPQTYSSTSKTGKVSPPGKTELSKETASGSGGETDYYDDDTGVNVNPHDHHFTHVDVPRIPFAKPNVPRVLVTNGKPFLPRLRRQSHHHLYYSGEGTQEDASLPVVPPASSPRGRSLAPSFHQFREEARMKAKQWGKDR